MNKEPLSQLEMYEGVKNGIFIHLVSELQLANQHNYYINKEGVILSFKDPKSPRLVTVNKGSDGYDSAVLFFGTRSRTIRVIDVVWETYYKSSIVRPNIPGCDLGFIDGDSSNYSEINIGWLPPSYLLDIKTKHAEQVDNEVSLPCKNLTSEVALINQNNLDIDILIASALPFANFRLSEGLSFLSPDSVVFESRREGKLFQITVSDFTNLRLALGMEINQ